MLLDRDTEHGSGDYLGDSDKMAVALQEDWNNFIETYCQ